MAPFKPIILCIGTETRGLAKLQTLLEERHLSSLIATTECQACDLFSNHFVDAAIIAEREREIDTSSLIVRMKQAKPRVPILLVSGYTMMSEDALSSIDAFVPSDQPQEVLLANLDRILTLNTNFFSRFESNLWPRIVIVHADDVRKVDVPNWELKKEADRVLPSTQPGLSMLLSYCIVRTYTDS